MPATLAGERVDRAVALLTGWSRAEVQVLIDDGAVQVDGRAVIKSRRLEDGEVVDLLAEPAAVGLPQPPGDPDRGGERGRRRDRDRQARRAHRASGRRSPGRHAGQRAARTGIPELAGVGDPARPGIVHRLDANTSGLLAVARTPAAYDALVAALARATVDRGYLALVWGVPDAASGVIDAPIGRSVRRPTRMAVREGGRAGAHALRGRAHASTTPT